MRRNEPGPKRPTASGVARRTNPAAIAVSEIARVALSAWSRLARRKTALPGTRFRAARISMFAMLLPKRLPAARSGASISTVTAAVASSGSEVANARRTIPSQRPPRPVFVAITSALFARTMPA